MKVNVLADVHVGSVLRVHLSNLLESPESAVSHAVAEGWADKQHPDYEANREQWMRGQRAKSKKTEG